MILKLNGNPCVKDKKDYRKILVVNLSLLEELDKIKVIQAERLCYQGLVKGVNIEELLEKYKNERKHKDAQDKLEREMFIEYMDEKGVDAQERLLQSLEDFAKFDEFEGLQKRFREIMVTAKEKQKEQKLSRDELMEKIDKEVKQVMKKYQKTA